MDPDDPQTIELNAKAKSSMNKLVAMSLQRSVTKKAEPGL
jgi:hypothetical protein